MTSSEMCKSNDMFIIEVIVKGGVLLDYIMFKSELFVFPILIHEGTPLNIMQSSTTPLIMTLVLKQLI